MIIDIYTIIGPNAAHFAEFAAMTMIHTSSPNNTLRFKYLANNTDKYPQKYWTHLGDSFYKEDASSNHSKSLNDLYNYIDPKSDISVIIDADIGVLYKGWDNVLVEELIDSNKDIIGTESGRHVGSGYHKKYNYFPNVWFMAMTTQKYLDINPDYKSIPGGVHTIDSEEKSLIFGLPKGEIYFTDTGWRLPEQFYHYGMFNYKSLTYITQSYLLSFMKNHGYNRNYNQEWTYNNKLFVTHYSQSSFDNERNHQQDTPSWKLAVCNHVFNS